MGHLLSKPFGRLFLALNQHNSYIIVQGHRLDSYVRVLRSLYLALTNIADELHGEDELSKKSFRFSYT